jgi:hypothetical protein
LTSEGRNHLIVEVRIRVTRYLGQLHLRGIWNGRPARRDAGVVAAKNLRSDPQGQVEA